MTIKTIFNNINFDKDLKFSKDNEKYISDIHATLLSLPSLNIVKNSKLLKETIQVTLKFAENKKDFLVFGTGGSNLGSKALINILQGNEKVNMHFFDNIDPINFRNRIKDNINTIKKLPKIKGIKKILYPGENKFYRYKKNLKKNIIIKDNIEQDIRELLNN